MATVWLQIVTHTSTASILDFRFQVDLAWLKSHTDGDLNGPSAVATLNASSRNMETWRNAAPSQQIPLLRAFDGLINVSAVSFASAEQTRAQLYVSGSGPIHKLPAGQNFADYQLQLDTGSVTIWTDRGFITEENFFTWGGSGNPVSEFRRWVAGVWPEANTQVAAVRFGRDAVQIDVKTPAVRRRLTLVNDHAAERIWKLGDCGANKALRTPRNEIDELRDWINSHLTDCNLKKPGDDKLTTAERRSLATQIPAEVYYRVTRTNAGSVIQRYLRPDFDIRFSDGESTVHWSPRTAVKEGEQVELHDADHIAALIATTTPPADPDPAIQLTWKKPLAGPSGAWPSLVAAQLPAAACIGVSAGEVQAGYVWQYATTSTAPAAYPQLPVFVRYRITESERQAESAVLPENFEGAIPISPDIVTDNWRLALTPQLPLNSTLNKAMSLTMKKDGSARFVELKLFSGNVRASSPQILSFTERLADPASPPNAKGLADQGARRDPFLPTSLVFASESRQVRRFRVVDLPAGGDLPPEGGPSPEIIWQTNLRVQPSRIVGISLTALGTTASFGAGQSSAWTININAPNGPRRCVTKSFTAFPAAGVTTNLGIIENAVVQPGEELVLSVVNSSAVDLPSVDVTIEFDSIASLTMQPEVAGDLASFHVFSSAPDAVQLFWPHTPTALIDPIPAAARNLQQIRDIETLRTIVERDTSHGISAWTLKRFKLAPNTDLRARLGGAGMAQLSAIPEFTSVRRTLHSAMSLLPWVACRDELAGATHQQLYSRNLALEPGEFAAASQDRTIDGRPMAFAASELDFVEAVRDPFALAVNELPTGTQIPGEIVNWLPGATLNLTPAARMTLPTAQSALTTRFPEVGLFDNGIANGQVLKLLFRDGSGQPASEPTDWLTYHVRRLGWDASTPVRPQMELTATRRQTAARNQQRLARNASVPLLFDRATVTCADISTSNNPILANWAGFGDQRGRVVVLDLARPTQRYFLRPVSTAPQSEMKVLVLARTSTGQWVVAVDATGEAYVWNTDQDLSHLAVVASALPNQGSVTFATGCQVGALVALFIAAPGAGGAKVVVWDPKAATSATNPQIVTALPGVVAADLRCATLTAHGDKLILAIAHEHSANPAIVLAGEASGATWVFNPMPFPSAVTASLIAVAVIHDQVVVGTVEAATTCRLWLADASSNLSLLDPIPSVPGDITAIAIGSRSSPSVLRPVPTAESDGLVYLSRADGTVSGWGFDLVVNLPTDVAVPRLYVGHNGTAEHLLAVDLLVQASGERGPSAPRPHLAAFGLEGIVRLWDSDSQQLYRALDSREDVYDNLGTLRTVRLAHSPSTTNYVEPINRPARLDVGHASALSSYAPFGSIVDYTLIPQDGDAPLISSYLDPEAQTELYLVCDRLRLRKATDRWVPETLEGDLDPGPDRPKLKFPFHRGFVGRYGIYSQIPGETPELNYLPRVAGLPIYPTSLNWLKFAETGTGIDFSQPSEIEFDAAIINPLDLAQSRDEGVPQQVPSFVQRAIHDGSVVRIHLERNAGSGAMEVRGLSTIGGNPFKWNLPIADDSAVQADEGLEGHLSRIVGTISYEMFQLTTSAGTGPAGRVVLRLRPDQCAAELLGGLSALDESALPGQTLVLVGYGRRAGQGGQFESGFETPRLPAQTSAPEMLPLNLVRTADRISLSSELTAIAVDELQDWNSLVSGMADSSLTWWDLQSSKPWSTTTLDANPSSISAASLDVPTMLVAGGTRLSAHDPELKYEWTPGSPQQAADFRTDWSSAEPITALAMHRGLVFVGNSVGSLLCWDTQGRLRFVHSLLAGPIIQLVVRRNGDPATPILAACDSTQSSVTLINGLNGDVLRTIPAQVLFPTQPNADQLQLRQLDLAEIDGVLYLAAVAAGDGGGLIAGCWSLPTDWISPPVPKGSVIPRAETVAIGREDTQAALYFVINTGTPQLYRQLLAGGTPLLLGDLPGSNAAIAFGEDQGKQFVAAASPRQPLRIWDRPTGSGWAPARNLTVTPADLGSRFALHLARMGNAWLATVGPGERLGDQVRLFGRVVQAISLEGNGESRYEHAIPVEDPDRSGILGPRLIAAMSPLPHAVVARNTKTNLQIVDLLSGLGRNREHAYEHGEQIRGVRWGKLANQQLLVTAKQTNIGGWDLADGSQKYTYDAGQDIVAIVSDGEFAAVASTSIRVWRWIDAPDSAGNFVEFTEPGWLPRQVAIRVLQDYVVVAVAAQSSTDETRRLEIWHIQKTLNTAAELKRAWIVSDEVVGLAILNDENVAVSFKAAGPQVRLAIFDSLSVGPTPTERWQRRLTAAIQPLSGKICLFRGLPVLVDGKSIGVWSLGPYLSLPSTGQIDYRLPIKLQTKSIDGFGTLTADLTSSDGATVHLTTPDTPEYPQRLVPGSVYSETFGLIGRIRYPGSNSGELGACLWRNVQGNIAGALLSELNVSEAAKLGDINSAASLDAGTELLQQCFVAFNPDAAPAIRNTRTTSGRITADLKKGKKLTLYIGDQAWDDYSASARPATFFAHMVWQDGNFVLQGSVLMRRTGATDYKLESGVYALQKIDNEWAIPTPSLQVLQPADLRRLIGQSSGTVSKDGLNWNVGAIADYPNPLLGLSQDRTAVGVGAASRRKELTCLNPAPDNEFLSFGCDSSLKLNSILLIPSTPGVAISPRIEIADVEVRWEDVARTVLPAGAILAIGNRGPTPFAFGGIWAAVRESDIHHPLSDGQVLFIDLASPEMDSSSPIQYSMLILTAQGLQVKPVSKIDVPFDLCLDSGIVRPFPSATPVVPQLTHRQLLGPRLRHAAAGQAVKLLSGTGTTATWTPPDGSKWLAAPIVKDGAAYRILSQTLIVTAETIAPTSTLQTENLILLSRDDTDNDDQGALVGLHHLTAESREQFLLSDAEIGVRIVGNEASGTIFHRVMRGSEPALFRIIPRVNATVGSAPASLPSTRTALDRTILDFRLLVPMEACRLRRTAAVRYFLNEPPVDLLLDSDRFAWRRFGLADALWPDHPQRVSAEDRFGYLISERTAFHRLPNPALPPTAEAIFPAPDTSAKTFRPRVIEMQLAPSKPGAMVHHEFRAIATPKVSAAPADRLPRPTGVVGEPLIDFAIREPLQLTPPEGTDLKIESGSNLSRLSHRQAARVSLNWKETLGSIAIKTPLGVAVPLQQIDLDPNNPPTKGEVHVGFPAAPAFMQMAVRINDEYFEVDERQPQFPVYDARQSASSNSELQEQTKLLREDDVAGTRRTPRLEAAAIGLDVAVFDSDIIALALVDHDAKICQLSARDPGETLGSLPMPAATRPAAVLATRQGKRRVLCNDDGTDPGIYLRDPFNSDPTETLSSVEAIDVRFTKLQSVVQHQTGADPITFDETELEVYAALADDGATGKLLVFFKESASTDGPQTIEIQLATQAVVDGLVQIVGVLKSESAPAKHYNLFLAVGGGTASLQDHIDLYKIDFSSAAPNTLPSCSLVNRLTSEGLTTFSLASIADQPVVFLGHRTGLVTGVNALGVAYKQYAHTTTVQQITAAEASGRTVVAVACEKPGGTAHPLRISVWDFQTESLLRTTTADDEKYGLIQPIQLANVLHFVAAQTESPGRIQIFDPRLTPYRPPELFFVSKAPFLDPITIPITYDDSGTQTVNVPFKPFLVLSDRQDNSKTYVSLLAKVLGPPVDSSGAVKIWKLRKPEEYTGAGDVDLRWHQAGSFRIAWLSEATGPFEERSLEAVLFGPLGDKQIKPVPYSEVAPKIAAVALIDNPSSGTPVEVMQRTLFFGDAATAGGGFPELKPDTNSPTQLFYQALGSETVDLPIPNSPIKVNVILVKHLINGQAIAACHALA